MWGGGAVCVGKQGPWPQPVLSCALLFARWILSVLSLGIPDIYCLSPCPLTFVLQSDLETILVAVLHEPVYLKIYELTKDLGATGIDLRVVSSVCALRYHGNSSKNLTCFWSIIWEMRVPLKKENSIASLCWTLRHSQNYFDKSITRSLISSSFRVPND